MAIYFSQVDGYGAFSVKPRDVKIVVNRIANQHERHKKVVSR